MSWSASCSRPVAPSADKGKDAADKQVDITKRRLELYQAQAAAGGNS